MTTSIRPAREDDLGRLIEIHGSAYPGSGTYDHQKRDFTHHPLGGLDDVRVIEKDGRIVGHIARQHGDLTRAVVCRAAACPEDRESRPRQGLGAGAADPRRGSGHDRGLSRMCVHGFSQFRGTPRSIHDDRHVLYL